jgi:hypothetical protein
MYWPTTDRRSNPERPPKWHMTTDMTLDQLVRLPVIRVDQLSDLGALVDHNVDAYRAIVEGTALAELPDGSWWHDDPIFSSAGELAAHRWTHVERPSGTASR